jgi:hypothetical protein
MRKKFIIPLSFIATLTIFSCSKDKVTNPEEDKSGSLITKMTQGTRAEDDTVYVFSYDADKRIKSVVDVEYLDTFEAVYNTAGLVSAVINKGEHAVGSSSFIYNADKQLVQADFATYGGAYRTRYTFEYTNGVVSKKNYYTQITPMGTELALLRYTTYEVTNGNITGSKEYSNSGTLMTEVKYTFNNEPNVFQPICLMNWENFLGADDIADIEMYFNKNLITGEISTNLGDEPVSATVTYTYNDKKQVTKVVFSAPGYLKTRQFEY